MDYKFQRELMSQCERAWNRIKSRICFIQIPSQDWEDIRNIAIERVFRKFHLFDEKKSKLYSWIITVMQRSTWNSLRKILPDKKNPDHKWRTKFQHAIPIRTFLTQVNDCGEETLEVVPDIIDNRLNNRWNLEEFKTTLNLKDAKILQARIEGGTFKEIAKEFNLKGIGDTQAKIRRFAKLYKEYSIG